MWGVPFIFELGTIDNAREKAKKECWGMQMGSCVGDREKDKLI